jgi:hypothetical protein
VSKGILSKIFDVVRDKNKIQPVEKNSDSVIKWFINLKHIKEFYPSIRKNLLIQALNFASKYIKITAEERKIIF